MSEVSIHKKAQIKIIWALVETDTVLKVPSLHPFQLG